MSPLMISHDRLPSRSVLTWLDCAVRPKTKAFSCRIVGLYQPDRSFRVLARNASILYWVFVGSVGGG